jgi:hypothetical protein
MTIDINELRQSLGAVQPEEVAEILDHLESAENERDALRARIEAMERQEPVAQVCVHKTGGNAGIAWSARPLNEFDSLPLLREGDRLYLAPGAQPAPSLPDTHNDMVVGLDYQGAMSCARQRAKKEAGLLYPEGDARKEEKERELASEYYRQYTTPNTGAKP